MTSRGVDGWTGDRFSQTAWDPPDMQPRTLPGSWLIIPMVAQAAPAMTAAQLNMLQSPCMA